MRNLLSGLVSGAGLVILWAMLTKPKTTKPYQVPDHINLAKDAFIDPAIWGERRIANFTRWPSDG